MQTRQNSSGRVQPTEYRNLIHPGTCALCNRIGRSPDEVFANLGVELDQYGVMYLCLECCAELANFIMFKSPEQYEDLMIKHLKLTHEIDTALSELARARFLLHGRIDSLIAGESGSNDFADISISEVERNSDKSYSSFDSDESESVESGS